MSDQRQRMIEALNSLEVVDWSASCGELEYVLAESTEENVKTLLEAGFTQEMIDESRDHQEDNDIDLTYLAANYANIYCWHKDRGFIEEDEWNRLAAAQGAV
jgi:hypothetical protein